VGNPNRVATDPVVAFKTAIWFWMTAQAPTP
jgi:basic endochitinase B